MHLVVSGRRAPHLAPRRPPIHRLPEREFINEVVAISGEPADPRRTATSLRYAARVLRADLELGEEYAHAPAPIPAVPISAFGGADDPLVARDEVAAWAHVTRGGFRMRILPGGHFFHHVARREIAAAVLTPPPGVDG